jgi:histidinol-phosphate aminotransferase
MEFNLELLVRENIKKMRAYSSARHEYTGTAGVFLDANENPFGSPLPEPYNRYPDPQQLPLKEKISGIKGVPVPNIFLGNGSDEAIDLLFRVFCEPGKDNVIICPPTYGMYEVCAEMNNVATRKVSLAPGFQLDMDKIAASIDANTKLIFICSPNNPTGNSIDRMDIGVLLNNFDGLVVVDEAYINYSKQASFTRELADYPNLVVLQTLSKAWGLAGLRLGMAFASEAIMAYLDKVKYPYNINTATQQLAISALANISSINNWTKTTVEQREWLAGQLGLLPFVQLVYPSDANFLLVKMDNARTVYQYLAARGIVVRDRSGIEGCEDCLRITVGTPEENKQLSEALKEYAA